MSQHLIRRNKAFTLIEILVSLSIMFLVLISSMSLYIYYWHTFSIGNTMLDVYSSSRLAMEWIGRDIRQAAQVVPNHGAYTTNNNVIVLQVPAVDASDNIIGSHYDYIIYQLVGSDLKRIVVKDALSSRSNETRLVARYCTSLAFSSEGVGLAGISNLSTIDTIGIYLPLNKSTISMSGGTQTVSTAPTTLIRLRNK